MKPPDPHEKVPDDPLGLTTGQRLQSALSEYIDAHVSEWVPGLDVPPRERTLKNMQRQSRRIL